MSKYDFNNKLEAIITSKVAYINAVQEYLQEFVARYGNGELDGNYMPFVRLLDKIPARDSVQVALYMASYGIKYNKESDKRKASFEFVNCTLEGCWSDFNKTKKAPKPYKFDDKLESFIKTAAGNEVEEYILEQLRTVLQDYKVEQMRRLLKEYDSREQ